MGKADETKMSQRNGSWQQPHFNGILGYILQHEERMKNKMLEANPNLETTRQVAKAEKRCLRSSIIYSMRKREQAAQSSRQIFYKKWHT